MYIYRLQHLFKGTKEFSKYFNVHIYQRILYLLYFLFSISFSLIFIVIAIHILISHYYFFISITRYHYQIFQIYT